MVLIDVNDSDRVNNDRGDGINDSDGINQSNDNNNNKNNKANGIRNSGPKGVYTIKCSLFSSPGSTRPKP